MFIGIALAGAVAVSVITDTFLITNLALAASTSGISYANKPGAQK